MAGHHMSNWVDHHKPLQIQPLYNCKFINTSHTTIAKLQIYKHCTDNLPAMALTGMGYNVQPGGCAAIINLNACSTYPPSLPPWQLGLHFIGAARWPRLLAQSVCAPGLHPGGLRGVRGLQGGDRGEVDGLAGGCCRNVGEGLAWLDSFCSCFVSCFAPALSPTSLWLGAPPTCPCRLSRSFFGYRRRR